MSKRKTKKTEYKNEKVRKADDYDPFDDHELQLTDRNIRNDSPVKEMTRIVVQRGSDMMDEYNIRPIMIQGMTDE